MRWSGLVLVVLGVVAGCALEHVRKDIPPPGGCDACHRHKISSDWEIGITPVRLGRAGGIPEGVDIVLGDLRQFPYHREVPAKRLAVYAAAASPEVIGNEESGIQCFVCHRSPDPPHEEVRGRFPHPWGKKTKNSD